MTSGTGVLAFGGISIVGNGTGGVITPANGGSLLALVGANTPVGYAVSGGWLFLDTLNDVAYFQELLPTTGDAGLKRLTVGTNGTETAQATETTIFGAGPAHTFSPRQGCVHPMGKIFMNVDGGNSCPWAMIDSTTLICDVVVGLSNASLNQSTNDDGGQQRFVASFQMLPLQNAGGNYVVSRGVRSASAENEVGVFLVDDGAISVIYAEDITEEVALLGSGKSGTDVFASTFHVMGDKFNRAGGDPTPVQVYRYVVSGVGSTFQTPLFSIAPTDIDATWTNFTAVSTPGYDLNDDCILAFFRTLDAVVNQNYLVKFNPITGAVVWKLAVTFTIATVVDLAQSSLNGTLGYISHATPNVVTLIDLSNGTTTTQDWNTGLTAVSSQIWDYTTGSLTGKLGYTESGDGSPIPTYLGAYLAANGNAIPSSRWGRIFTGAPYPSDGGGTNPGSAPQRAWTFTLDGHTFYVLDLDDEGTFVYDIATKHWSKFVTESTDPLWNMAVGTMWKHRVVGGDRASGVVWELDQNAQLDNGTDDITRVVTGIMPRRSRNVMSVGALRVSCSSGHLNGDGTATFSLRFSDDQGNTWVGPYALTLTVADYSQEVAFIGLGSFQSPGRLFELSDSGGLVRIDAADIDPELDDDSQAG